MLKEFNKNKYNIRKYSNEYHSKYKHESKQKPGRDNSLKNKKLIRPTNTKFFKSTK